MKPKTADTANGSIEMQSARVLRIANRDEFQQSFAVAQLAVKLWENKTAELAATSLEKQNAKDHGPNEFLEEAWKLIESAREHVLWVAEREVELSLKASLVPFHRLCDPARKKFDTKWRNGIRYDTKHPKTETINGAKWKVFTTVRAFDNLFWAYWNANSVLEDPSERKKYGQSLLASWKRCGVPATAFSALAECRRERDNRAGNLKKKPKSRRRQLTAKAKRKAR
jgi:hypothetical protein